MFGTRDEFEYLECGSCGTLQIAVVPDLAKYYPSTYYSLDAGAAGEVKLRRRMAMPLIGRHIVTGRGRIGQYLAKIRPAIIDLFPQSLRDPILSLDFDTKILDFGCGNGELLRRLRKFGFLKLTGSDAFIEKDINCGNGLRILKRNLDELNPSYDLIMLHHSFEHLPDPLDAMSHLHRLLKPGKICLIRIPLVNYAWEKYGVNWAQLDPPRHLFLYTERSFARLAENGGFMVEKIVYDSEAFQFFGSEQYARDISLNDPRAYRGIISESIFTPKQLDAWEKEAVELNKNGRGDQACFYLRKV